MHITNIYSHTNIQVFKDKQWTNVLFCYEVIYFQTLSPSYCNISNIVPIVLHIFKHFPYRTAYFKHCPHRTAYFQTLSQSYCIFSNIEPILLHIFDWCPDGYSIQILWWCVLNLNQLGRKKCADELLFIRKFKPILIFFKNFASLYLHSV